MSKKRILSAVLALLLALSLGTGALGAESAPEQGAAASTQSAQPSEGDQAAASSQAQGEGGSAAGEETASSGETQGEADQESGENQGADLTVTYDPTAGSSADPVPESTAAATLLMDGATGTVLWQENAHEVLEPASVTKIMTMLLVCEALDAGQLTLDQMVTTSAHAAGMGGSQVYLEEGEQMTVQDLLKAVAVASGNDAAVALGEAVAGSESAFVEKMNQRAARAGDGGHPLCQLHRPAHRRAM